LGGRHFVWGSFTDQANAGLELALNWALFNVESSSKTHWVCSNKVGYWPSWRWNI
jgi:hypothetical protein